MDGITGVALRSSPNLRFFDLYVIVGDHCRVSGIFGHCIAKVNLLTGCSFTY